MAKNLVIVESPAKAKTINKFIGKDYVVKASVGHVRDLPKSELGVDEVTFEPTYQVLEGKEKVVSELRAAAKNADRIYIASDPDREGEAIGWHVMSLLGNDAKKVRRVLFHEITKNAVRKAMDNPGEIDMNKVNAQQARRVLDRLVGYKISPLLWDKVRRGLSAGRVQSVAMKMIVDREEDIKAFKPVEYWTFAAKLAGQTPPPFVAKLTKVDGKKAEVPNEEDARKIEAALKSGRFVDEKTVDGSYGVGNIVFGPDAAAIASGPFANDFREAARLAVFFDVARASERGRRTPPADTRARIGPGLSVRSGSAPRFETNAMLAPSGDHAGSWSSCAPGVRIVSRRDARSKR